MIVFIWQEFSMTKTLEIPEAGQIARVRQRLYVVEQTVPPRTCGHDPTVPKMNIGDLALG